jgi:hypothetical protein
MLLSLMRLWLHAAKHLRDVMTFQKNWNNEVIVQFYTTLYVEEHEDIRKFHWMTEGRWFKVTYAQFARFLGFERNDASHPRIHMSLHLDAKYMKFMYPKSKRCNCGTTTYLLPFYTYTNRLFRKIMTPREGDGLKIPSYNKNILAVMAPNGYEFLVFGFIWEEIKAISNSTLKSCGYASYIMHIIERVMGHTFGCDKEHHPLRINNDLKAPVEDSSGATPSHGSSSPRTARGSGRQSDRPPSPL